MVTKKQINDEIELIEKEIKEIRKINININKRLKSEKEDEDILFKEFDKKLKEYGKKVNKILKERTNWAFGEFCFNSEDLYIDLLKAKIYTLKNLIKEAD